MSSALRSTTVARRSTTVARTLARLVAALAVAVQLLASVHAAGVPHVTCPEHGEGMHLGGARAPSEAASRALPSREAGAALATAAGDASRAAADGHDHCRLQQEARSPSPEGDRSFVDLATAPPVALPERRPPAPVAVLSFAPKTSPPTALSASI